VTSGLTKLVRAKIVAAAEAAVDTATDLRTP
jgi:hypothetical protein